jgi:phage FluMu protein Com
LASNPRLAGNSTQGSTMSKIRCSKCRAVFASDAAAGHSIECPVCHTAIRVPSAQNTSAAPRPAAQAPPPSTAEGESSGAWKVIFPLAIVFGLARKFGCDAGRQSETVKQFDQLTNSNSSDLTLMLIVVALLAWGAVVAIERFVRKLNEPAPSTPASSAAPPPPPPLNATGGWWMHCDGKVVGPHSTGTVIDALGRGEFTRNTPSCRAGESQWLPLASRPEFANACST